MHEYYDKEFGTLIRWQQDLIEGFDHEFLPGAEDVRDVSGPVYNSALMGRLEGYDPDVVQVYGFWHGISRQAIRWARKRRKRILVMADSELRSPRSLLSRLRKRLAVPWFLRKIDGVLTVGDRNEEYYLFYGFQRERLFRCPFTVDEERLATVAARRWEVRKEIRGSLGLGEDAVIALTVGKLTKRKCADHPIRAMAGVAKFCDLYENLYLVIAGDGPERPSLEVLADELCRERVRFAGFVNVEKLPEYYVAADLLIHPSSEDPHPLAVTEAVFAGLPVVVSDRVGSVGPSDDVRAGENGVEYPFGDIRKLSEAIARLYLNGELREEMAERSRTIARGRGLETSIDGFVTAVMGRAPGQVVAG
jgi:glycosyltransferase involved in cell wall biosynthesis